VRSSEVRVGWNIHATSETLLAIRRYECMCIFERELHGTIIRIKFNQSPQILERRHLSLPYFRFLFGLVTEGVQER